MQMHRFPAQIRHHGEDDYGITWREEKKRELKGTGRELDGWSVWCVISSRQRCVARGIADWVSREVASSCTSSRASVINMLQPELGGMRRQKPI